jgi:DNA (cytosine-5)-methyltransferase 1
VGFTVVDLFSGAGGFSVGFRDAGFEVVAGLDVDLDAVRTFSLNFPKAVVIRSDARLINGSDIVDHPARPTLGLTQGGLASRWIGSTWMSLVN